MAKKKKTAAPANIKRQASNFLRASTAAARQEYGDSNMCVMGDAGRIVVGVPLPGLAMEYLLQNDVFPLGRMSQVVGTEGTCKSALCFEMARWFKQSSGITYLFENETKYSPDFAQSIIGYPDEEPGYVEGDDLEVLAHYPCDSLEDWQSKIQFTAAQIRKLMTHKTATHKPTGRVFPVLFVLDSITGKLSRETSGKIDKAGHASRAFAVEALLITNFLKKFPQDIEEWPISFVVVNHLKPQKSMTGAIENNKAGGRGISFQVSFEFEMKRAKSSKVKLVDPDEAGFQIGGNNLRIICRKNSLGETHREIFVSIFWKSRYCEETNTTRQYSTWDWAGATVDLISAYDSGTLRDKTQAVVDLHRATGNRWWSKRLGISKEAPISKTAIGQLIEDNDIIKDKLRGLFGIKRRKHFVSGKDYLEQLAEVKEKAFRATGSINSSSFDDAEDKIRDEEAEL